MRLSAVIRRRSWRLRRSWPSSTISPPIAGWNPWAFEVDLLTSSIKGSEREDLYGRIRKGEVQLVIGTHALIQETVEFQRLGLAIIDEQHKFGVVQRGLLKKKGENPDVLVMTATPIPRTLAMTVYGDLDVSVIDEMPPGRMPVETTGLSRIRQAERSTGSWKRR